MTETQGIFAEGWFSQNANRAYPLDDDADRLDSTESWQIPNDLIVDLIFPVHADAYEDPTLFHVLSITVFSQGVIITIGYNGVMIATASISGTTFTQNSSYALHGQGDFEDSTGRIIIGSLDTINDMSPGTWTFSVSSGRLSPAAVIPDLEGVSSVQFSQGSDISDRIQGELELVAGMNCQFRLAVVGSTTKVYIDFIDGEGSIESCACDEMPTDAPCIRTINGIYPNSAGDFTLLGSNCISMAAITNGIYFSDVCSEPCCGCDELAIIQAALENLNNKAFSLDRYVQKLDGSMSQLLENVIASKVSQIPS